MIISLEHRSPFRVYLWVVLENMYLKELLLKLLSLDSFCIYALVQVISFENHSTICFANCGFYLISQKNA